MYRTSGILIVVGGLVLASILLLLPYDEPLDSFEFAEDGGLVRRTTVCPAPGPALWGDASAVDGDRGEGAVCRSSAQTKVAEAVLVAVVAVLLSSLAFWGGRRPKRKTIDELARPLPTQLPSQVRDPDGES